MPILRQFTRDLSQDLFSRGTRGWRWVSCGNNERNWTALWSVKWTPGVELHGALNEDGAPAAGWRAVMWYELKETPGTSKGNVYLVIDSTHMQHPERQKLVQAVNCICETLETDQRQSAQELYAHAAEFLNRNNRQEVFFTELDFVNDRWQFLEMAAELISETYGLFEPCVQ